jgi:hypothetical protein
LKIGKKETIIYKNYIYKLPKIKGSIQAFIRALEKHNINLAFETNANNS